MITVSMSGLGFLNLYGEKEISAETVLDIFTRKKIANGHCFFRTDATETITFNKLYKRL